MVDRHNRCLACEGTGMLSDDEGWQYECSICHGDGINNEEKEPKILEVDANHRLLD